MRNCDTNKDDINVFYWRSSYETDSVLKWYT